MNQRGLLNVGRCDAFVLLLNQRYGPSLASVGFADESATHLEYHEAKRLTKPMFVFARDRLLADHSAWKRNGRAPSFRPSWLQDTKTDGTMNPAMFTFLDEHLALQAASPAQNWCDSFKDSVELKAFLGRRLERESKIARLALLEKDRRLPHLLPLAPEIVAAPGTATLQPVQVRAQMYNAGPVLALEVTFHRNGNPVRGLGAIPVNGAPAFAHQCCLDVAEQLIVEYVTSEGDRVRDTWWATARTTGLVEYRDRKRELI